MSENLVRQILVEIGDDPEREGLLETPKRVSKAWKEWFSGYGKDPANVLKVFEDGAENYNELVIVHNIPVYSFCEHHMAPIMGKAHVGYIPDSSICGLSKLHRLVDIFARRLQVQERLTTQVAQALMEELRPLGVGVLMQCRHMCMESRGVKSHGEGITTTSAMRGAMMDQPETRAEFLALCRGANDGV